MGAPEFLVLVLAVLVVVVPVFLLVRLIRARSESAGPRGKRATEGRRQPRRS